MDTVICRVQSGLALQTTRVSGTFSTTLYSGLYQGFGPTVIASIPASIAFFTVYESVEARIARARAAGRFRGVPRVVDHVASSAIGELLACAILNPAQVLKQNAQVFQTPSRQRRPSTSPTAQVLKQFARHPSKLWTGYSVLVAAHLPSVCLTFAIYESLKEKLLLKEGDWQARNPIQQVQGSALCAAVAGCCSSWAFVPADVVKTRMRIAAGAAIQDIRFRSATVTTAGAQTSQSRWVEPKALSVARQIIQEEGWTALFRGSILTCIVATVGSAIYLGSYEAIKIYCDEQQPVY